ncbi:hypothetical protein K501DRAFT_273478 [Backusella circina FSU 941]|nr:hypothetical protein K501DRAFT_273478 [Backusella circina FSU 941]
MSISNAGYKVKFGTPWFNAIVLKKREEANIQDVYDKIPSPKVPYQSAITGYQHRERQGYMYSNKKTALDFISSVVIIKTKTEEPVMLAHTSYLNIVKVSIIKLNHTGSKPSPISNNVGRKD